MLTDSKRKRWYQMPISNTCKEVGKNQSFIYYPSLGYKRKNEAFVIEKSFLKSCPYGERHFPLPFQGERRLMVSTFQPSEGALLAQNACNCQNSKMTFPPPQPLVVHIVYNLPLSVGATCKYNGICLPWWCSFYYKRDFFFHSSLGLVEFIKCKIILDGPCLRR